MTRPTVLMVSKPVVPPWNDSGKNLVKDLVTHGARFRYRIFTDGSFHPPGIATEPIYAGAGRYTPSLGANARVFARLCRRDDADLRHFFFAPNPTTSRAARVTSWLRRVPTVQTVASSPASYVGVGRLLFADRVVALSEYNRRRLVAAGVDARRVVRIPPCVEIPASLDDVAAARARARERHGLAGPVVLYPGDYQFSTAAWTLAQALPRLAERQPHVCIVFACRIKQPASRLEEQRIQGEVRRLGLLGRCVFLNEVSDILDLVAAADVVTLPAESTYAKMDLPLVLLEAMARAVPVVVADAGPLAELADAGAADSVPPGDAAALANTLADLLTDEQRRRDLGARGRAVALAHHRPAEVARRHEDLYAELTERKSA